jgi:nicotinamidase-related amidase
MRPKTQTGESFFDLRPEQVVVVLVDFQNDFCSPQVFHRTPVTNTLNAETAQRANAFARQASVRGVHVISTRQVLDLDTLTLRQRRWERADGLCAVGSWGANLFVEPVPDAHVVAKHRFDVWQSRAFVDLVDRLGVDGLVIGGVELCCCVLYAVLGAEERGYHYVVAQDLVSGQDLGAETYNRAVRDYLRITHGALESADSVLRQWGASPAPYQETR